MRSIRRRGDVMQPVVLEDPLYSQKNPHQMFLLTLSVVSSWPLLRGEASSAVLERELSDLAIIMWGASLLVGSVIALAGSFWRRDPWTGLVIERGGLALVGSAAVIYSTVVWTTTPAADRSAVSFATGLTFAYGASCFWRVAQIWRRLRWMKHLRASQDRAYVERYDRDAEAAYREDERRG